MGMEDLLILPEILVCSVCAPLLALWGQQNASPFCYGEEVDIKKVVLALGHSLNNGPVTLVHILSKWYLWRTMVVTFGQDYKMSPPPCYEKGLAIKKVVALEH